MNRRVNIARLFLINMKGFKMSKDVVPVNQGKKYGKYDEWDIKHFADVLSEAEEIKNDKEKMKYVLPLLEEKKKAADNVLQAANILYGKNMGEKK